MEYLAVTFALILVLISTINPISMAAPAVWEHLTKEKCAEAAAYFQSIGGQPQDPTQRVIWTCQVEP
jgi:hypothetical protein